ncbi:MAG TPA: ABC transporter substrate-binding protein [Miltoncostaeaceae bacterium]|nr:ABC transporter substrate-binding protein [Miltoncostaeaceae bacterium]
MKRRAIASLLAASALVVGGIAAGCGDDDDSGSGTSGGGGGDVSEVKLGVLVPLTGQLADFGGPGSTAANLAAEQVNTAGADTGLKVTLVTEDTKTDPQAAQEAATKVIESDGVAAIAGPWATPELIPTVENVTVDAGIPIVTPSATGPDITNLEDDGLVFRTPPSDAIQGQVLAQVVTDALGEGKTVNTASRNDSYGDALVSEFTKAYEALGGTVAKNVSYNPDATSLNSEAQQIVAGDPDGWVIIDYTGTWPKLGPALVRTGKWDPAKTFTGDGLRSSELPKDAGQETTNGIRGTVPTSLDAPAGAAFDALWTSNPDNGPRQTYDAQNFDAVILLALASLAAGSTDGTAIAEALPAVSGPPGTKYTYEQLPDAITAIQNGEDIDYEGASGPIDLDENGDPSAANYSTWSYTGGKLVDTGDVIGFTKE